MCDDDTRLQRVVPYILVRSPLSYRIVVDELNGICQWERSNVLYVANAVQRAPSVSCRRLTEGLMTIDAQAHTVRRQ